MAFPRRNCFVYRSHNCVILNAIHSCFNRRRKQKAVARNVSRCIPRTCSVCKRYLQRRTRGIALNNCKHPPIFRRICRIRRIHHRRNLAYICRPTETTVRPCVCKDPSWRLHEQKSDTLNVIYTSANRHPCCRPNNASAGLTNNIDSTHGCLIIPVPQGSSVIHCEVQRGRRDSPICPSRRSRIRRIRRRNKLYTIYTTRRPQIRHRPTSFEVKNTRTCCCSRCRWSCCAGKIRRRTREGSKCSRRIRYRRSA